ncbi:hypothetical protein T492DRAFT_62407 [Pavlovales sp. CCMP2436]|nr:hypothetical protein T492DRAFT_62407 [Pavlovales sp. CCMP2436]
MSMAAAALFAASALAFAVRNQQHGIIRSPVLAGRWRIAPFLVRAVTVRAGAGLRASLQPEPGPCPNCADVNTNWDGARFVYAACGHEWATDANKAAEPDSGGTDEVTRDSNGVVLSQGDSVILIKALGKDLKKGLKICNACVPKPGTTSRPRPLFRHRARALASHPPLPTSSYFSLVLSLFLSFLSFLSFAFVDSLSLSAASRPLVYIEYAL